MNIFKRKFLYAAVAFWAVLVGVVSCSDFDDHYKASDEVANRVTLWELISQQPELSTFADMLKQVSYDKILSSDQSYTVWAPGDDALAAVDRTDEEAVLRLVTNHIARYTSSTAVTQIAGGKSIYMVNAKKMLFSNAGGEFYLGAAPLDKSDLAAKNGILHTLKKQLEFHPSVWQFMEADGYDSIRNYLYAFDKLEFNRYGSTPIDTNEEGLTVYDSVFVHSNELWPVYRGARGIGYLNNEDSTYTMIVPDNNVWTEVYNTTYQYFRPDPSLENPDSIQAINTRYAIVQDLVFRGNINPNNYGATDTLVSTRGAEILDPQHLFAGLTPVQASNGIIYPTSQLTYKLEDSCIKPLQIEAELGSGRWHDGTFDAGSIYTYWNYDIPISNSGYLYVTPASSSSFPSVSFELPNVLAAEYDIYCVYLSQDYTEELSDDATRYVTRLKFDIQQWDRVGKKELQTSWKTIQTWQDTTTPKYITQPTGITNMLVAEKYAFPFASFEEEEELFRLKVTALRARNDSPNEFKSEMRIDYIRLEPSF